jgi:homoserine kinase
MTTETLTRINSLALAVAVLLAACLKHDLTRPRLTDGDRDQLTQLVRLTAMPKPYERKTRPAKAHAAGAGV